MFGTRKPGRLRTGGASIAGTEVTQIARKVPITPPGLERLKYTVMRTIC